MISCSGDDVTPKNYSKLNCKIDGIPYHEVLTTTPNSLTSTAEWHKFELPNGSAAYKINSQISGTNEYEFAENIYITLDANPVEWIHTTTNFNTCRFFCHFAGTTFDSRDASEGTLIITRFDRTTMSGYFSLKLFSGFSSYPMVSITEGEFKDIPKRE